MNRSKGEKKNKNTRCVSFLLLFFDFSSTIVYFILYPFFVILILFSAGSCGPVSD